MSCLMEALQDKRVRLQPECKKRLQDRIDMWSYAAKVSNPICTHKTNPQKIGGKKKLAFSQKLNNIIVP